MFHFNPNPNLLSCYKNAHKLDYCLMRRINAAKLDNLPLKIPSYFETTATGRRTSLQPISYGAKINGEN